MQESTLLKICLFFSILGICVLFILSKTIQTKENPLLETDKSYLVKGTVSRITERESVTYINIQKEDELTVILFKDYPIDLHSGDYVEVKGTASADDEGNLQLIGKEVRVIK